MVFEDHARKEVSTSSREASLLASCFIASSFSTDIVCLADYATNEERSDELEVLHRRALRLWYRRLIAS